MEQTMRFVFTPANKKPTGALLPMGVRFVIELLITDAYLIGLACTVF